MFLCCMGDATCFLQKIIVVENFSNKKKTSAGCALVTIVGICLRKHFFCLINFRYLINIYEGMKFDISSYDITAKIKLIVRIPAVYYII